VQVADASGNVVFESVGSSNAMAAGTTARFTWAANLSVPTLVGSAGNVHATALLPVDWFLRVDYAIQSVTVGA
jgi:hypothetical protein